MSREKISIPRPGRDITPRTFFEQWLPENLVFFGDLIRDNAGDLSVILAVRVGGEGEWNVTMAGGEVKLAEKAAPDADITLVLSRDDFIRAVSGRHDDLLPGPAWLKLGAGAEKPAEIGKQIRRMVNVLKKIKITLLFKAPDPGQPFQTLLSLREPPKPAPDTIVTISQEVLKKIAQGELSATMAFMTGKISIKGDMAFLIHFAPLLV